MGTSRHVVAAAGLAITGVLALSDELRTVPAALAATAGAWWILRDQPSPPTFDVADDVFLPPDDVSGNDRPT